MPAPATLIERDSSLCSSASRTAAHASTATLRCASELDAPMCGVRNAFGARRSGWSAASGSFVNASTMAPRSWPLSSAVHERRFLDDAAARHVHGDRAALEARELAPADHALRLLRERRVHRDHVRDVEPLLERGEPPDLQRTEPLFAHIRIVARDVHPERERPRRDLAADAPHADDHQRLSLELGAEELRAIPLALAHRGGGVRKVTHQSDERAEEQLGDGHRVARRRVDDGDAERRRRLEGDVVHADAGASDDAQARRALEQRLGDARRAAPDERVVVADALEQLGRRQRGHLVDDERRFRGEQRDAVGVDVVGDEDSVGHGSAYWGAGTRKLA